MQAKIIAFLLFFSLAFSEGIFVVGTNAEFPPFCFKEADEIVGFDIDIAKEVGKRLGKQIKFKDMPFDGLLPELILEKVDFLAAGMSATEERARRVLFTKSYLQGDPLVCVTAAKSWATFAELVGKKILVNEGYTADIFVSNEEGYEVLRLSSPAEALIGLKQGKASAFITAKSTLDAFMLDPKNKDLHATPIEGTSENCSLVFPKTKQSLLQEVQVVLDAMEQDGTIATYKVKWGLQ